MPCMSLCSSYTKHTENSEPQGSLGPQSEIVLAPVSKKPALRKRTAGSSASSVNRNSLLMTQVHRPPSLSTWHSKHSQPSVIFVGKQPTCGLYSCPSVLLLGPMGGRLGPPPTPAAPCSDVCRLWGHRGLGTAAGGPAAG